MPIASELSIDTSATAFTMADTMFGSGVTVVSATYTGDALSSGTYTGGTATLGELSPSDTGVILSTGQASDFTNSDGTTNTNTAAGTSTDTGGVDGDTDLNAVSGQSTFDGAFLDATFIPDGDTLTMQFVFSSEEYLEYVNGGVNDAIGIWVNGSYVPLDTGDGSTTDVTIDTINSTTNENLYLDNPDSADTYNTEMDGSTVVLSVTVPVNVGVENDIRIGIADGGDSAYDSNLLIMGDSVQSQSIAVNDSLAQGPNTSQVHDILANDTNEAGNPVSITHINNEAVNPGDTVILNTGEQITLNPDGTITILTDGDIGTSTFTYSTVDSDGTPATGFVNIETTTTPPNFIVEGTAGSDTIDAGYTGDPEGDMIDNADHSDASDNDSVLAGAGNDSVVAGAGDDTVFGSDGADTLLGGAGNDTLDGDDVFASGGADYIDGGTGNDQIIGDVGNDTLLGGDGNDTIYAGADNDSINGNADNDLMYGEGGDDSFWFDDGFGSDTVIGGETGETTGDTLQLASLTQDTTIDLTGSDPESGTVTSGTDTITFSEIESIILGGGRDTILLADGSGADSVTNFDMTDSGDGTTNDQLDVSGLTDANGAPVNTNDVTVTDDGNGNAVLTFPGGESITLVGVAPTQLDSEAELVSIGIPAPDYIVEGTAGDDIIDAGYTGDPEGDMIDSLDHSDGSNNDSVLAGAGNDSVLAGAGDDTVFGEAGADTISGGDGADTIDGGIGADSLSGGIGDDLVLGGDDNDWLTGSDGNDTVDGGAGADSVYGGAGNDSMLGGTGNDSMEGWIGNDTMEGGAGLDYIDGGDGADSLVGGDGNDTLLGGNDISADTLVGGTGSDSLSAGDGDDLLYGGTDADSMFGGGGDDTFFLEDGFGNDTIHGWSSNEVNGDTLDLSAVSTDTTVDLTSSDPEAGTVSSGADTASFVEIENIVLGGGRDTIVLADGSGSDAVSGFDMTDSGDGTTNDQLDVSGLTSDGGTTPVTTLDVVVTDDGNGNAVLTFPGGESITLIGVAPAQVDSEAELVSIGIPAPTPDYIVEGTAGGDTIDAGYTGDPEGDMVDAGDNLLLNDDDSIEAYGGDDVVSAGLGNDTVDAGTGNDSVLGEAGNDSILGGDGLDTLIGGAGDDTIHGGNDADTIFGGDANDSITGGQGFDSISGDLGNDVLYGDGGNDTVAGGAGADTIYGGVGADDLYGGDDNDTIFGEDGTDEIWGDTGADSLVGGAGNDTLFGGTENDTILGGADNDLIFGETGVDSIDGGDGNDTINGGIGGDILSGGADADVFVIENDFGPDTITGGETTTTGVDYDTININTVSITSGVDVQFTGDEAGTLSDVSHTATFSEIEALNLSDFNDTVDASLTTTGVDIDARDGNDSILGGSGNDTIDAGPGADTVDAGAGNDIIDAGLADGAADVFVMSDGDGDDTISNFEAPTANGDGTFTGIDQIDVSGLTDAGGDPVTTSDVVVTDTNGDGTGDAILQFPNGESITLVGVSPSEVSSFEQLVAIGIPPTPDYVVEGTAGDDTIDAGYTGDPENDMVDGNDNATGTNDDLIDAGAGNDSIVAGLGNDTVYADEGNDTVFGEDGNDSILGFEGSDSVDGGAGDDYINTRTSPGTGAPDEGYTGTGTPPDYTADTDPLNDRDTVIGGIGNDTILTGDDNDTVYAGADNDSVDAGFDDDLVFGEGGADTLEGNEGNDTILGGIGDDLIYGELSPTNPDFAVSDLYDLPNDGTDAAPTNNGDSLDGGDGNDTIFGQDDDDTIDGGTGNDLLDGGNDNDLITGGDGLDTITGGHGNDTVFGGLGADSIDGGIGNDSLMGNEGNDTLTGGDGSDYMDGGSENDLMFGGDGNDTVYGNSGDDTLYGGAGDDFVRGSFGADALYGGEGNDSIWAGFGDDTIYIEDNFGNDSIDGDFDLETNGDTLDLTAVTTGLTIDLTNSNPENGTFTDGTSTANFSDIENIVLSSGNDTITLADFGGDDTVYGFESPTVNGDGSLTGNDMLDVSGLTSDFGTTPINARDVVVTDDGAGNAVLNFPNGESLTLMGVDPVTASDHAYLVAIGIPSNEIVDGTAGADVMGTTYVDSEGDQTDGTDGLDDTIMGYAGDDTIDGGLGADTIDGGADNDVIDGGAGADSILGGDGNDTVTGGADNDIIDGGAGNDSLSGGAGDDTIDGWVGDDTLVADGGNDSLTGFDGDDTFQLTNDTGNTTIVGGEDAEVAGDTLDLSGVTEDLTIDLTNFDWESGTVSDGTNTTTFSEIETIVLGGGVDTLVLADGGGVDTVEGFEAPTPNGDGTFTGVDQLDVSGLTSDGGFTPVHVNDVVVTDDGSGNAVLNFPNGETLTLIGVSATAASDPAYLVAMGIPSDGILTGTDGADTIVAGTWVDEDTEVVDGGDALLPGAAPDDDSIRAGAGDDVVSSGLGDDQVDAGFGNDTVDGGAGDDSIIGGSGNDSLSGGADNDTLLGEDGSDTLTGGTGNDSVSGGAEQDLIILGRDEGVDTIDGGFDGVDNDTLSITDTIGADVTLTADEDGTVTSGTGTATFTDIENLQLGSGADTVDGSATTGGINVDGGAGADSIIGGDGADIIFGGDDADTIIADRNDTVDGGSGGDDNDTLVIVGPATIAYTDATGENGTVTWLDGQTMTFTDIENIDYIPCFTPGTLIKTARGEVPVEQLRVGDRALTRDSGYQVIRWVGARALKGAELADNPALNPILIRQGALGNGLPVRDMKVSPQHRMLMSGPSCELWFGEQEVLVAACHLIHLDGVEEVQPEDGVTYVHILFDQHEVVQSDGTWSESFQPGDLTLGALDAPQRAEILTLFPELASETPAHEVYPAARITLKAHQARVLFA